MKPLSAFFAVVGVLFIIGLIAFAFQGTDFFLYKFWAPKYESVQRDVFEQTPSYVRGNIQELENMRLEYNKCKSEGKEKEANALKSVILHRAAGLNQDHFPEDLKQFIIKLKGDF